MKTAAAAYQQSVSQTHDHRKTASVLFLIHFSYLASYLFLQTRITTEIHGKQRPEDRLPSIRLNGCE